MSEDQTMRSTDQVSVFSFELFDGHSERPELAAYQATREAIAALGGRILESTERQLGRDELDSQGRYRRIATGWGELC